MIYKDIKNDLLKAIDENDSVKEDILKQVIYRSIVTLKGVNNLHEFKLSRLPPYISDTLIIAVIEKRVVALKDTAEMFKKCGAKYSDLRKEMLYKIDILNGYLNKKKY